MFTLRHLLEHEELHLELVVPGAPAPERRRIAGAHAIEVANPAQWVPADWVMLMTGVRVRRSPDQQRQLVEELHAAGIGALGLAVDIFFKDVPWPLAKRAEELAFPVFTVPHATPFRDIIAFVNGSLISSELYVLRRTFSMHRYLMDALSDPEPEQALVQRLAAMLQSSVFLFTGMGAVVASSGRAPPDSIWMGISSRSRQPVRFQQGPWSVVATPVRAAEETGHWLVVTSRRSVISEQVVGPIVEAAERLIAVILRGRRAAAAEERALRSALLSEVTGRPTGHVPIGLADRLSTYGFSAGDDYRVVVFESRSQPVPGVLRREVEHLLASSGRPFLLGDEDDEVVALIGHGLEHDDQVEPWLDVLADAGLEVAVGIGRPVAPFFDAADSLRDARLMLSHGRRPGVAGIFRFDDVDLVTVLLREVGAARLRGKAEEVLGLLLDNPMLLESLHTWFSVRCDVSSAAKALHLHPNSIRYRLGQIEKLLGVDLRDPGDISNLYLAVTVLAAEEGAMENLQTARRRS